MKLAFSLFKLIVKMELVTEYIKKTNLVSHQITTFNDFVTNGIQEIVNREPDIITENAVIKIGQVFIDTPKITGSSKRITKNLYPNEARNRNITYAGTIYVNVMVTKNQTTVTHTRVGIGEMPVMLRSMVCNINEHNVVNERECPNDPGGYFIIKGKERVLVGQLRQDYNKTYVFPQTDKYEYMAEMRSINSFGNSVLVQAKINSKYEMCFSLPYLNAKDHINAGLAFKALGVTKEQMFSFVHLDMTTKSLTEQSCYENVLEILSIQYDECETQSDAEIFISKLLVDKDQEFVKTILKKEVFCHLGTLTPVKTGTHLGFMIKKLVETMVGKIAPSDKDHLANKRLDTTSSLIAFLFQGLYKQFLKNIQTQLAAKKNLEIVSVIKNSSTSITHRLHMCFMTGAWEIQKNATFMREGVSQILSRQNYKAAISHCRRIMLPIGNKGKNVKMRQLHSSHFGFVCPYETPEGPTVGIVLNLAMMADVSLEIPTQEIIEVLETLKTFSFDKENKNLVLVNGIVVGSTENGYLFSQEFNEYRNSDRMDPTVSCVRIENVNEVHICSDHGRLMRPVFVVKDNEIVFERDGTQSWEEGIKNKSIVFKGSWELDQHVIAMTKEDLKLNKCDFAEIYPAIGMMGISAVDIPFPNHSQSPRVAYQACMGKQAIGTPTLAFQHRYDTTLQVLDTPQIPITRPEIINVIKFNEMSHGCCPIVAIMTYTGFNQEDSIILNRSSIERGLFHSTTYKTITEESKKRGNSDFETICLPKYEYRRREYNYEYLNEDGIINKPKTGSLWVRKGDVIIGKTLCKMTKKNDKRCTETLDTSVVVKHGEEGYVDSVLDAMTNDGIRVVKIRLRIPRIPEIGDKFASSTAQKGTCGMIYSQEDMPFDKNGITPDLIMNPHAIPSRMTINMLIEMCYNLVGCENGKHYDATAFAHGNVVEDLNNLLVENKWDSYMSTLYCGFTGQKIPSKIYMGPTFYQRLKHLVATKIHSRMCGPLDTLTHQPVAGRAKDGGLRFGEMERDAVLAQGCSRFLKECLFDKSDKYTVAICTKCGNIPHDSKYCHKCKDDEIEVKNMPFATKLLYQELMAIGTKITFE